MYADGGEGGKGEPCRSQQLHEHTAFEQWFADPEGFEPAEEEEHGEEEHGEGQGRRPQSIRDLHDDYERDQQPRQRDEHRRNHTVRDGVGIGAE